MAGNRIIYTGVLLGTLVFYIAYGEWISWLILLTVLGIPWISLLVSLPAILRFRIQPAGPDVLVQQEQTELLLLGTCQLPMPPFRGRLRLKNGYTGDSTRYPPGSLLHTEHCGCYRISAERCRICDYLGLFSFPVTRKDTKTILIRPRPVPVCLPEDSLRAVLPLWKPKFGGGYAENHELRLYRPGDNLNQVHWKLTAKTGKLMLREPMEPVRGRLLLSLTLSGPSEELDRKLGRLLWLSRDLLRRELSHECMALTEEGLLSFSISDEDTLWKAVDTLLQSTPIREGQLPEPRGTAWHYVIGGEPDEK